MREHSLDTPGKDEPEDGWVGGERSLTDTEILSIALCKFTGEKATWSIGHAGHAAFCMDREAKRHPDEQCIALYHSADAIERGVEVSGFPNDIDGLIVRVPRLAGEPVGEASA